LRTLEELKMPKDSKSFESKPATADPYRTKNSTATYGRDNGDAGAARVGNTEPNPYGANLPKK
jgi:hypothetical protein